MGRKKAFSGKGESFPVEKMKASRWEGSKLPGGKDESFPVGRQ